MKSDAVQLIKSCDTISLFLAKGGPYRFPPAIYSPNRLPLNKENLHMFQFSLFE